MLVKIKVIICTNKVFLLFMIKYILKTFLQDCVLFHDTIEHNLRYGDLNADIGKVEEAAKMAELHDSIVGWPKGYLTQVRNVILLNDIMSLIKKI